MKIDLSVGGDEWQGWEFGRYGNARNWRLHSPNGDNFQAPEIIGIREVELNADYWQVQHKQMLSQLEFYRSRPTASERLMLQGIAYLLLRAVGCPEFATRFRDTEINRYGTGTRLNLDFFDQFFPR